MDKGIMNFLDIGLTTAGFTMGGLMIFASGIVGESFIGLMAFTGLILSSGTCVLEEIGDRRQKRKDCLTKEEGKNANWKYEVQGMEQDN